MGVIPSTPGIIPMPFANNGQKNTIAESNDSTTDAHATWSAGFPPITMINKQAGGKPPYGLDFNGLLNILTQHVFFGQSGCVYHWNGQLNYLLGAHVLGSDNVEYIACDPSGPDVPATETEAAGAYIGAKDPTVEGNDNYWKKFWSPETGTLAGGAGAPYNVCTVLISSGIFTAPVAGWYKVMCIGGGGGGGGGKANGYSGGGGGAGMPVTAFVKLTANQVISYTIGAGGTGGTTNSITGGTGGTTTFGNISAVGGEGGKSYGGGTYGGGTGDVFSGTTNAGGGAGALGTLGYGGGGGGAGYITDVDTREAAGGYRAEHGGQNGIGGAGGHGAIILEYFNPAVTA